MRLVASPDRLDAGKPVAIMVDALGDVPAFADTPKLTNTKRWKGQTKW